MTNSKSYWLPLSAVLVLLSAAVSWGIMKEKVDSNKASIAAVEQIVDKNTAKLHEVQFMTRYIYKKMGGPEID